MSDSIAYKRDRSGDRYIVALGDDRIGFVKRAPDGQWNAVDTFMAWSGDFASRDQAGVALLRQWKRAVRTGKV